MKKLPSAIGINYGTTYSCVGIFNNNKVQVIPNNEGKHAIPSCVAFTMNKVLVGEPAKNQISKNPKNTIYELKERAEKFIGYSIKKAVITVPAHFNDQQKQAMKNASIIADLDVLNIINEPTAAAITYRQNKKIKNDCNVLVFNMGSAKFDVSIFSINNGKYCVKSTVSNIHLGGNCITRRMVNYVAKEMEMKVNIDITKNRPALRKLERACKRAKETLTSKNQVTIQIDYVDQQDELYYLILTRKEFEELNEIVFNSIMNSVTYALSYAKMSQDEIKEIILVGGSTRIPKIQILLKEMFRGRKFNTMVNPTSVVIYGAAIQAAILTGYIIEDTPNLPLFRTPLSLGIESAEGLMTFFINRNTITPVKISQELTTSYDNQVIHDIKIYEGERIIAKRNNLLGSFQLTSMLPRPQGYSQFMITFEIDCDGILTVTAENLERKVKNQIQIQYSMQLPTTKKIKEIISNAKKYSKEDNEMKDSIIAKVELEVYIQSMYIFFNNVFYSKLTIEEKNVIDQMYVDAVEWMNNNQNSSASVFMGKKTEQQNIWRNVAFRCFSKYMDLIEAPIMPNVGGSSGIGRIGGIN